MRWKTLEAGVLLSEPGFCTSGYDMRVLALTAGKSYQTEKGLPVIVNMLRGRLSIGVQTLAAISCEKYDIAHYHSQDEKTEYKRIAMKIGHAHPLFSAVEKGVVSYPWHAYVTGDQGALFAAFEDLRIRK